MRLTGERYTAALLAIRGGSGAARLKPQEPEGSAMNEAPTNEPHPMVADMFRRFTNRSRTVVVKSENLARREGLAWVDPRHVLLGVVAAGGTGWEALGARADISALEALASVEDVLYSDLPHVPYRPVTKKVLEQSLVVAVTAVDNEIRTEHLLAALIDREDQEVLRMLNAHRIDPAELRQVLPAPDAEARAATRAELSAKVALREVPTPLE